VGSYKLETQPIFCGRSEFFRYYYDLVRYDLVRRESKGIAVLAAYAKGQPAKLGKTRLLAELAIRALEDGNIPVLLRPGQLASWEPPKDALDLATWISDTIERVRTDVLDLSPGANDPVNQLYKLGRSFTAEARDAAALDTRIARELRYSTTLTPKAVRKALEIELAALAEDARKKYEFINEQHGQVIVLLDDVDRYGDAIDDLAELLDDHGLGTSKEPVPVVMTFTKSDPTEIKLAPITGKNWDWLLELPLKTFVDDVDVTEDPEEDLLAYKWLLLNPFKVGEVRRVLKDLSDPQTFLNYLRDTFQGTPGMFADKDRFYAFSNKVKHNLSDADDEQYIAQWRQANPSLPI
jgi:hypothetical protein